MENDIDEFQRNGSCRRVKRKIQRRNTCKLKYYKRSSTNFSKVPDDQTDKAVNLALNTMKDKDESLHISFTGDTMILIMKMHEEDGGGYEIIVSNDYKQAYIDNEVFK